MSKLILKNAAVQVNGVNLSDHASKVTIATTFNEVDTTSFGATYKAIAQGIGDASITVDFHQDYAVASVDATLWPLSQSGSVFPVVINANGTVTSSTNPSYTMQAILSDYNPIDGGVGDLSTTSVKFSNGSQSGITRATV